jgi:hypothetical protein
MHGPVTMERCMDGGKRFGTTTNEIIKYSNDYRPSHIHDATLLFVCFLFRFEQLHTLLASGERQMQIGK